MEDANTSTAGNRASAKENQPVNYTDNASQRDRILDHLRSGSLTTLEARKELDVMHPAGACRRTTQKRA
jgi:hypothetical protein